MEFELKLSEFEWEDEVLRERKGVLGWRESERKFLDLESDGFFVFTSLLFFIE